MFDRLFCLALFTYLLFVNIVSAQKPSTTPHPPLKYNMDSKEEKLRKINIRLEIKESIQERNQIFRIPKDKEVVIQVLGKTLDERIIALGFAKKERFTLYLLGNNNLPFEYPQSTKENLTKMWNDVELKKSFLGKGGGPAVFIFERESLLGSLKIADWYGKLEPGVYKVVVLFGFGDNEKEKKIQSEPITFEITP